MLYQQTDLRDEIGPVEWEEGIEAFEDCDKGG